MKGDREANRQAHPLDQKLDLLDLNELLFYMYLLHSDSPLHLDRLNLLHLVDSQLLYRDPLNMYLLHLVDSCLHLELDMHLIHLLNSSRHLDKPHLHLDIPYLGRLLRLYLLNVDLDWKKKKLLFQNVLTSRMTGWMVILLLMVHYYPLQGLIPTTCQLVISLIIESRRNLFCQVFYPIEWRGNLSTILFYWRKGTEGRAQD